MPLPASPRARRRPPGPTEFFRRTYLTEGLKLLLRGALLRLAGTGGDPVVELQTSFGGGKTHAMLALYHLASGADADVLPGIDAVLQSADGAKPVAARRAVLVGTALSPGQVRPKPGGIEVRTLWGELAWQLGGADGYGLVADADGYGLVADADRSGTNPGTEVLADLFKLFSPCLVLIKVELQKGSVHTWSGGPRPADGPRRPARPAPNPATVPRPAPGATLWAGRVAARGLPGCRRLMDCNGLGFLLLDVAVVVAAAAGLAVASKADLQ